MDMQKTCIFRHPSIPSPDALTLLPHYCVLDTQFPLLEKEWGSATTYNPQALRIIRMVKCLYSYFCFIGQLSLVHKTLHT
jgi:hypothetical protein